MWKRCARLTWELNTKCVHLGFAHYFLLKKKNKEKRLKAPEGLASLTESRSLQQPLHYQRRKLSEPIKPQLPNEWTSVRLQEEIVFLCNLEERCMLETRRAWSRCLNYTIQNIHYLSAASLIQTSSPKVSFPVCCHLPGCCQTPETDTLQHTGLFVPQISRLRFLWSWQTAQKVFFFFFLIFFSARTSPSSSGASMWRFHVRLPLPACSPGALVSTLPRFKTVLTELLGDLNYLHSRCERVKGWRDGLATTCTEV